MQFRNRPISLLLIVVLALALLAPGAAFAGGNGGKPQAVQASSTDTGDGAQLEVDQKDTVSDQVYDGVDAAESQSRDALKEDSGSAGEESGGPAKGLPVLRTEPADGAVMVRPDAEIRIVLDTESKAFKHVSKQLEKGHFYVTLNGRKAEAAYDGKNAVEVKPSLLQRYTRYAVEFVLHPDDQGKHLGFGNGEGKEWENKTYRFSFETGSALHEPRHAKISVSSMQPRVTEGAEIELEFTDDYGQPGWDARGRVILTEQGSKPDTAAVDPFEFTVPEGSDGKVRIRVSDTEAEKVSYRVEVSGPYPEDAAQFDGEITFRPGPAAKVSLSVDREKVVAGQSATVSGTAEDVYGNPVEDGTPVSVTASAGDISGASTKDGAFSTTFIAPTKKQTVALTVRVDQAEAKLDVPVIADVPARVTVVPEKTEAEVGQTVSVSIYLEDQYGNSVEDGTRVTLTAQGGSVSPCEAVTKDGRIEAQVISVTSGEVMVTAATENGASGSAVVLFKTTGLIIFGNQAWTDTGIDVSEGVLIRVSAQGSWISGLYAKIGEGGTPVKVGADGGFVTGVAGRLYLGPYNKTYADNLTVIVRTDDPAALGILPNLTLWADPSSLPADGQSMSTVSCYVKYGQYSAVRVKVEFSATLGTITNAAYTNQNGYCYASFKAGTTTGNATISAIYSGLERSCSITLTKPEQLVKEVCLGQGRWYKLTKDDWGYHIYYSNNGKFTWIKSMDIQHNEYGWGQSVDIGASTDMKRLIVVISTLSYYGNYTWIDFRTWAITDGTRSEYRSMNSLLVRRYKAGTITRTSLWANYPELNLTVEVINVGGAWLKSNDDGRSWWVVRSY